MFFLQVHIGPLQRALWSIIAAIACHEKNHVLPRGARSRRQEQISPVSELSDEVGDDLNGTGEPWSANH